MPVVYPDSRGTQPIQNLSWPAPVVAAHQRSDGNQQPHGRAGRVAGALYLYWDAMARFKEQLATLQS